MRKIKRKQKKARQKAIRLSKEIWLRNAKEIKAYRETELLLQEGKCAITGIPLIVGCLDHTHAAGAGTDGRVRGVLLPEVNCIEGKYLKIFQKFKLEEKYGLNFPQLLINMGEYLQQDNSEKPYHVNYMEDLRNYIKRLNKPIIAKKLKDDFGILSDAGETKVDLVQKYIQAWVDLLEDK